MFKRFFVLTVLFGIIFLADMADAVSGICFCDTVDDKDNTTPQYAITSVFESGACNDTELNNDPQVFTSGLTMKNCKWQVVEGGVCFCDNELKVGGKTFLKQTKIATVKSPQESCKDSDATFFGMQSTFSKCSWKPLGCSCDVNSEVGTVGGFNGLQVKIPTATVTKCKTGGWVEDDGIGHKMTFSKCSWVDELKPDPGPGPGGGPGGGAGSTPPPPKPTGPTISAEELLKEVKLENPLPTTDMRVIFGKIVAKALGVLGSLTLLVFIYGGVFWLIAAGNAETVKKGTQTMMWAGVGLFIIFGAYGMITLVFSAIGAKDTGYNPWGVAGFDKTDIEKAVWGCYCNTKGEGGAAKKWQPDIDENVCKEIQTSSSKQYENLENCQWQLFQTTAPTSTK